MCKSWPDIINKTDHLFDDLHKQTIFGYFLISLGIDLTKLPNNFFEPYSYFPRQRKDCSSHSVTQKVYLKDIVGSSYREYTTGNTVLSSFLHLRRITAYIQKNCVTRGKYLWQLKRRSLSAGIVLSKNPDGTYFVDGNGNHRVLAYKMIMLAEIAQNYPWVYCDSYDVAYKGFDNISRKYWLYATVNDPNNRCTSSDMLLGRRKE